MVGFAIGNIYTISKADIPTLFANGQQNSQSRKFLITTWMLQKYTTWSGFTFRTIPLRSEEQIIVLGELTFMVLLITRMIWCLFVALVAPRCFKHHGDMIRW